MSTTVGGGDISAFSLIAVLLSVFNIIDLLGNITSSVWNKDIRTIQHSNALEARTSKPTIHALGPRTLVPSYIVSYYIDWNKTSRTHSTFESYARIHSTYNNNSNSKTTHAVTIAYC